MDKVAPKTCIPLILQAPVRAENVDKPSNRQYESCHHAGFRVAVFRRGWQCWAILALMALIAGPSPLLLAPCWLARRADWAGPNVDAAIRWCAGATFSIYLFHYPILTFLYGLPGYDGNNAVHVVALAGVTLVACFALAEVSERRLDLWKRAVNRLFSRMGRKHPAAQRA